MFCYSCGKENPDNAKFCRACGKMLVQVDMSETEKTIREEPVQEMDQTSLTPARPVRSIKDVPVLLWVVLSEAILIVVAVVILANVLNALNDPSKAASRYFVSLVNGNYEEAFDELGLEESEFIDADGLKEYCAAYNLGQVTDYTVDEYTGDFGSMDGISDLFSGLGDMLGIDDYGIGDFFEQYEDDSSYNSETDKVYIISYNTSEGDSNEFYVQLRKSDEKSFLVFDKWNVVSEGVTVSDYHVMVPSGATITLDKEEVSAAYVTTDTSDLYYSSLVSGGQEDEYVVYNFPEIYVGNHTITVNSGEYDTLTQQVVVSSDNDLVQLTDLSYSQDTMKKLHDLAAENVKKIYSAAESGQPFSAIQDLFTTDTEQLSQIRQDYQNLVNSLSEESIKKITINKISTSSSTDSPGIKMTLDYTVNYEYNYWWYESSELQTYNGTNELVFSFENVDGKWLQTDLGASTLYY